MAHADYFVGAPRLTERPLSRASFSSVPRLQRYICTDQLQHLPERVWLHRQGATLVLQACMHTQRSNNHASSTKLIHYLPMPYNI
jgi:hypothetical protein